jgi:hypothetical protein
MLADFRLFAGLSSGVLVQEFLTEFERIGRTVFDTLPAGTHLSSST